MNRILSLLPRACPCCSQRERASRLRDRIMAEAERLEMIGGDVFEFFIPSVATLLGEVDPIDDDDDDDDSLGDLRFFLHIRARAARHDEDLRAYTVGELKRLAGELLMAADRLEGTVVA